MPVISIPYLYLVRGKLLDLPLVYRGLEAEVELFVGAPYTSS